MRPIFMNLNTTIIFSVSITSNVVPSINYQLFFPFFIQLMRTNSPKQPRTNNKIVVHIISYYFIKYIFLARKNKYI